jgi:hypothetical protein
MRKFFSWSLILVLVAGSGWWFRAPLATKWRVMTGGKVSGVESPLKPDPLAYAFLIDEAGRWRKQLAQRHAGAKSEEDRKAVEHDARVILEMILPAMMRCWLGTPWDYHGTASAPGGGKIACGYFVSTVLRDAGFQVDRFKLAKQPSENILRSFLPKDACTLTVGMNYGKFANGMADADPGIYLIGLDTHVGFLVVDGSGFRMIHSSGSRPWCVVDEARDEADVLRKSSWRMTGNLTISGEVIRRWLRSERIAVRGA